LKDLPPKRSDLYKQGINLLLEKWDEKRGVRRELGNEVYRNLSVGEKKKLLCYLAARKFEQEQYVLFEQGELQGYIAEYLGISTEDSEAVLDAVAAQHGLLIERAQGFWSFSHLTFQEYFTAKWFCDRADWEGLSNHVSKISWREVFLLAVERIPNANELIQFMKQRIDELAAENVAIQKFLIWLDKKSTLVNLPYKRAAVRAFYFIGSPDNTQGPELAGILDPTINQTFDFTFDSHLTGVLEQASRLDLDLTLEQAFRLDRISHLNLEPRFTFTYLYSLEPDVIHAIAHGTFETLDRAIIYALYQYLNPHLKQLLQQLQKLKDEFLELMHNKEKFKGWIQSKGKAWREQLRSVIIQYRNIGYDWQLESQENKVLNEYYHANLLLVKCLNRSCNVSFQIQEKIEENLLLPIDERKEPQQPMSPMNNL
jgi:predicted NACHT family NTPase